MRTPEINLSNRISPFLLFVRNIGTNKLFGQFEILSPKQNLPSPKPNQVHVYSFRYSLIADL